MRIWKCTLTPMTEATYPLIQALRLVSEKNVWITAFNVRAPWNFWIRTVDPDIG